MAIECTIEGAEVLMPHGWSDAPLTLADGLIRDDTVRRRVNLSGYKVWPGIIDVHGDGFERHMAPRRGALREAERGIVACASELAANGVTTAVLAQFFSWEGGIRSPDFAEHVFQSVTEAQGAVPIDLRLQLRLETHLIDDFGRAKDAVDRFGIGYVVFNDHLPHERLAEGRKPPRLTGQALKAGRDPDAHFAFLKDLHARGSEVPEAVAALAHDLRKRGVVLGSHDDTTSGDVDLWSERGASVSEFPETHEAAKAARARGAHIVLGAPNVVRGASHAGNISASDLISEDLCDAIASDYHYPSPLRATLRLAELGICDLTKAWRLVSSGPAALLGLTDRGALTPGQRADVVVLDPNSNRIVATLAEGQFAFLSGPVAERFMA